jgi:hypothetical protein
MIYLKSFLVGLSAVVLAAVIIGITTILTMHQLAIRANESRFYAINFGSPLFWVIWSVAFGIGFYWEYHRLLNR